MAKTLLDVIQQNSQAVLNPATTGAAPTSGETTDQVGNLLRTGQTGKEQPAGGTGPRQSAIGEKLANQQTQAGFTELAGQAQVQNEQTSQQDEMQRAADAIENEGLEQKRQIAQDSYNQRAAALLQDYQMKEKDLDLEKDKARTEQMGFMVRLGSKKYEQQLQAEGAKNRLLTQQGMDEAIARNVFADERDLLENDLSFKALIGQKNRDVMETLANIDLNSAIQLAYSQNQAANESAMWSGVGGLASAGAQAYANQKKTPVTVTNTETFDDQDLGTGDVLS